MGREVAITDKDLERAAKIVKIINVLASGGNITKACQRAGISVSTWAAWKKDQVVADMIAAKHEDVTLGVREVIADSLTAHMAILCGFAKGEMPRNSSIKGILAPRDVIQAGTQVMNIWKDLGGAAQDKDREQQALVDELTRAGVTINQYVVNTMNVGTESQPMPVPIGADIIEGEVEE